jgi:hypothetical protein
MHILKGALGCIGQECIFGTEYDGYDEATAYLAVADIGILYKSTYAITSKYEAELFSPTVGFSTFTLWTF